MMTPPTSNDPLLNEIVFPAGILTAPAFSMQVNDAINYGATGVVIGHEISHGFDDQGAQYDAQGRVIGPLSNLPEFGKAFSCKPGSTMVRPPDQHCEVW